MPQIEKLYFMPTCLAVSITRYGSRVSGASTERSNALPKHSV